MQRFEIMNCPMDSATMNETVESIVQRISNGEFTQHVVVNVAKIVNMQSDAELADSVKYCDIINIDGMGVVWAARALGYDVPERVTGIDLFYALNARAKQDGLSVYYLGATNEIVTSAASKMSQAYPGLKIAGFHHGYFWDNEQAVVEHIKSSGADMLFVAITSPKKERFINQWKEQLGVKFVMGIGGTLDIVGGQVKRAPEWMQKTGLEWLYRLLQEPGRLWKRYFITNAKFAGMLIKAKLGGK